MDRRAFLGSGATGLIGLTASSSLLSSTAQAQVTGPVHQGEPPLEPQKLYPQQQQFRVSYTTNTRGGWEFDPFVGMSEARDLGFRYVEIFGTTISGKQETGTQPYQARDRSRTPQPDGYVYRPPTTRAPREKYFPDRWEALQHRIYEIGVQFTNINGGPAGGSMAFSDPAKRRDVVDAHFNMARFSSRFGCNHQKINCGPRKLVNGVGVKQTPLEELKSIAAACEEIGKRCREELGIRFGVHAHLGAEIATEFEIDYLMENTRPENVAFVLDTSMVNMAGIDPLALSKKLGDRVCEYHLKDNAKDTLGGKASMVDMPADPFNDPISYPLGEGGVDFPALINHLRATGWRGHLVVELETSPWRTPKDSAAITAKYLRDVLKLEL